MKIKLILIPLALVVLAACQKENESLQEEGRAIRFSAEASVPQTRVSYSGEDSAGKERLEWSAGDRISIWCPESAVTKVASYSVGAIVNEDAASTASSVGAVVASEILEWGASSSYTFYARYPDPTWTTGAPADAAYTDQTLTDSEFTCVIPATQAPTKDGSTFTYLPQMQYCYMTAYATAAKQGTVALNFTPVVNTFEISIANSYVAANEDFEVTKVELISSYKRLNGSYSVTIGASPISSVPSSSDADDRIITFSPNVTVTSGETLKFTVFTCPVDIAGTEADHLSVKVYLSNGDTRTKKLKNGGSWLSYAAGGKYRIDCGTVPDPYNYDLSISGGSVVAATGANPGTVTNPYTLEIDCKGITTSSTFTLLSVKNKLGLISESPWKVEYSADGAGWSASPPSTVDGFTVASSTLFAGSTSGETVTVTMPGGSSTDLGTITIGTFSSTNGGTSDSPLDLSYYDGVADEILATQETANCYIIRGAGWYSFPLVYGNGIKNGTANTSAYHLTANSGGQLVDFVNGNGDTISSVGVNISGASTAEILWQDCTDDIITNLSIEEGNKVAFQVQNPKPCNAVIQVKDGSSTVLWSWHIWLAADELNLAAVDVTNHGSPGRTFKMLTSNLGQLPVSSINATGYQSQDVYVRFTTDVNSDKAQSVVLKVTRPRHITKSTPTADIIVNPTYQWGRKDPMLTAGTNGSERTKPTPPAEGTAGRVYKGSLSSAPSENKDKATTIANAIMNPGVFYTNENGVNNSWFTGNLYYNLWDTNQTSTVPTSDYSSSIKSIYDPCPRGYKVARRYDFTGFTTTGGNTNSTGQFNVIGSFSQGWNFKKNSSDTEGIFVPATGCRTNTNGALSNVSTYGYVWSSSSGSADYGSNLFFYWSYSASSVRPLYANYARSNAYSIRPVKDE